MTLRRPVVGLLTAAAVASLLAACGSSSSSSSTAASGTATAASSSAPAGSNASGSPIVVGTICSCSGFAAASLADVPAVVSAWTKYVNANGGINGHPVQVKLEDDAGDAATALQAAKTLVEQDHVMAIVGEFSNEDTAFQKYAEQQGVPVVGGQPYSTPMSTSPDFFPTGATIVPSLGYGLGAAAKALGKTKYAALYCAEAPVCGTFTAPFAQSLKNAVGGMSLVYSGKIAANAPSYTAQCLAAKQAGADAMFIGDTADVVTRVLDNCTQQGYKPAQFNSAGDIGNSVVKDPNSNGTTVIVYNLPVANTTTPGGKLYNDVIDKYAAGIRSHSSYGDALMEVFAGLQMFRTVGNDQKLTPSSTPAEVKAGLYALKNETLGGIAPPLNYVAGKPTAVNCWFQETIENQKLVVSNPAPQCVPPDKIAPLYKAFGG